MDPVVSPLAGLVAALAESERFRAFAEAFPANARVSEPALPLVLAALQRELARPFVCLLAEDEEARDVAEAVGWYGDPDRVALLPSRGVRAGSGLEPPAHLVGERARALDVLDAGGLVCASARALAEGAPPASDRPEVVRLSMTRGAGLDELVEALALAGYERVERVEERGQIAVRGGLVDVFPSTGREPLRVEFFGDELEQIRAFSPFTQRALHVVDEATIYPARERTHADPELAALMEEDGDEAVVPLIDRQPDAVWQLEDVER
ncbi:MAG TPA: hypothetical protein VFT35_10490, partial [Gaiellaceae bacterium]|nr:hypothetical protein [Gaiellaceae bacterium]